MAGKGITLKVKVSRIKYCMGLTVSYMQLAHVVSNSHIHMHADRPRHVYNNRPHFIMLRMAMRLNTSRNARADVGNQLLD